MEFVATGWSAGKQLRLDQTITELGMFDNCCIDHKIFNIITLLLIKEIETFKANFLVNFYIL